MKTARLLCVALMIVILAGCKRDAGTAGAAPATKPAPVSSTIETAAWKVTMQHPPEWVVRNLPGTSQPVLFKPKAGTEESLGDWEVDVKTGIDGRTVDQILEQQASAMVARGHTMVVEKKVETRGERKVGILLCKTTLGADSFMTRDCFWALDANSLVVITETAPEANWAQVGVTLAEISKSAVVEKK